MAILRAHQRKQMQEGLNTVFGLAYNEWPELWRDIFTVANSDKAFEEDVLQAGLGGVPEVQGQAQDADGQRGSGENERCEVTSHGQSPPE